jgi:hypothetical protein
LHLQRELQKREGQILQDALRAPDQADSSDDDDQSDADDDLAESDPDEETRAHTLANTSKAHRVGLATVAGSSPGTTHGTLATAAATTNTTNVSTFTSSSPCEHDLDLKRVAPPSTVAQIYDPSLGRLLQRHEGASDSKSGLDFLMESTRVKRAMKNKKQKLAIANISTGFGRMTEAQIERNLDALEKKKQLERERESNPNKGMHHGSTSHHGHHHSNSSTDQTPVQQSPKKQAFFPSLWRKITGS